MKFTGVGKQLFQPYADIALKTGVGPGDAGAVMPSITDEEAIALWDKLTSSIRVRPTRAETSQAEPRRPLGSLAATGRICEQSGLWECDESRALVGERRCFVRQGEPMPRVLAHAAPGPWTRIKGEQPVERQATMWTLVGDDDLETHIPDPPDGAG